VCILFSRTCVTCPVHLILLVWKLWWYLVRSTNDEAPYSAVFCILLYFLPFRPKMSSLASCSPGTLKHCSSLCERLIFAHAQINKVCSSSYTSEFYEDQTSSKWISVDCAWRFKYSGAGPGPKHAILPFVKNHFHPNTQQIIGKQNLN
jgi:hypothetical protein